MKPKDPNKTYVVHIKKEPYDVYIGRPSKWSNPYTQKKIQSTQAKFEVQTRKGALEKYEEYLYISGLINDIEELRGKVLGCWCCNSICDGSEKSIVCHGQILARILNNGKLDNQSQLM